MKKILLFTMMSAMMATVVSGAGMSSEDGALNSSMSKTNKSDLSVPNNLGPSHISATSSAIKVLPQNSDQYWPIHAKQDITYARGIRYISDKIPYTLHVPSIIPYGYHFYTVRQDANDVLEIVYRKKGLEHQEASGRWVNTVMAFRTGYSIDTVRDVDYTPSDYHDTEWVEPMLHGYVQYTGDVKNGMVRSVTWTSGNLAYFMFFLDPVKVADADFYRDHLVVASNISPVRKDLIGLSPNSGTADSAKINGNVKAKNDSSKIEMEPKTHIEVPPRY